MSGNRAIGVYSEKYDLMLEMLGKGRELADKQQVELVAVLIGYNVADKTSELMKYGADKVYLADDPDRKSVV